MKQLILILFISLLLTACSPPPTEENTFLFDTELMEKYNAFIQQENETGFVTCYDGATITDWYFDNLTTLTDIKVLTTDCFSDENYIPINLPNHYIFTFYNEKYFISEEEGFHAYFNDIFEPLDTLGEAREYLYFVGQVELGQVDDLFPNWVVSADECYWYIEAPEVDEILSMTENGFLYHGFYLEPLGDVSLMYYTAELTSDGEISSNETYLANCGPGILLD